MANAEHEFSDDDNWLFVKLAGAMRFVGIAVCLFAALQIVFSLVILVALGSLGFIGVLSTVLYALQGCVLAAMGLWTIRSAGYFHNIATTEGSDIQNLMLGLGELFELYNLKRGLFILAIILWAVGLVVALFSTQLFS